MMNTPAEQSRKIEARRRVMLIVWFALLMAIGIYFALTLVIMRPPRTKDNSVITIAVSALSVSLILVSLFMKQRGVSKAIEGQSASALQSAMIVAWTLCDAAALFGFMLYFVTSWPYYYLLFGVGIVGMLLNFPQREHLLAVSGGKQF